MATQRVVELRVHGVSGTPPEELLDRPSVRQVAGDGITGFYRPRLAVEALDEPFPPERPRNRRIKPYLEGYAWGGLTSGAPSRALWLLLLPFALLNVAPRLRPDGLGRIRLGVLLYLSRLIALASTLTLVLGATGIGAGLIGWQCGGPNGSVCTALPDWLHAGLSATPPGGRLLLGALLPLALLAGVWWVSHKTVERYEAIPDRRSGRSVDTAAESGHDQAAADELDPSLEHPWMWRGKHMIRRLQELHLTGGLLIIVLLLSGSIPAGWGRLAVTSAALVALLLIVVALGIPSFVGRREPAGMGALPRGLRWAWRLLTALAGLLLIGLVGVVGVPEGPAGGSGLAGYNLLLAVLFLTQMVLVAVLVLLVRGNRVAPCYGLGTPLFAAFGVLLGAAFTAGLYVCTASWLVTGNAITRLLPAVGDSGLLVPAALRVAAVAFGGSLLALVLVLAAVALLLVVGWWEPGLESEVTTEYADERPRSPRRDVQIQRIYWRAGLVDRADRLLAWVIGLPALAALPMTALSTMAALGYPPATALVGELLALDWLYRLGAYAAGGLLALMVTLGWLVFRAAGTRRSVGILWDLASFWPRSVHPLAPPCYAERTVPDIKQRVRWHVTDTEPSELPRGAVVLAAHSQGSVLAAAALLQLTNPQDRAVLSRVAFLSYGCVLGRLYARYFPAYFGPDQLRKLLDALGDGAGPDGPRWRNLWRRSDYVGGQVGCELVPGSAAHLDQRLVDPRYSAPPGELGTPLPGRHSGYSHDPAFQAAVRELAASLPTGRLQPAERSAPVAVADIDVDPAA